MEVITDSTNNKSEQELKEALEYQIDIVLRLEEERLLLLKENKLQKQKIKELTDMVAKYTIDSLKSSCDQQCQTDFIVSSNNISTQSSDQSTQTDITTDQKPQLQQQQYQQQQQQQQQQQLIQQHQQDIALQNSTQKSELDSSFKSLENLIENESLLQYSKDKEDSILNQAQSLLNKHSQEKSTPSTMQKSMKKSQLPIKELKFKKKEKENSNVQQTLNSENQEQTTQNPPKLSEKEIIAQELIKLTKEYNQIKKEMKKQEDNLKKRDKDNNDLKKQIEVKNEMLNKLRTENAELSLIVNNDKFKSVKQLESDLKKCKQEYQQLRKEHSVKCEEKVQLQQEIQQFKTILEKLTQEYNKIQNCEGGQVYLQKENQKYKEVIEEMQRKLKLKQEELSIKEKSCQEMISQCQKMNEEIDYFKQLSKSSKDHAEKALQDIEFYRNIIKKNNITLN